MLRNPEAQGLSLTYKQLDASLSDGEEQAELGL